jgi:hypothetical protein
MPRDIAFVATELREAVLIKALPDGLRLDAYAELLVDQHGVPERFLHHGMFTVGGVPWPRETWAMARPHADAPLYAALTPAGGDNPVKSVLGIAAAVLLSVATAGLATTGAIAGFQIAAAGSAAARALAAGLGLIGQLAIQALFSPPPQGQQKIENFQAQGASIGANQAVPGGDMMRVAGTLRIPPTPLMKPRSYLVGDDTIAEMVFGLAGAHQISDIQISGVPAGDFNGVEIWIDDGTADVRVNQFDAYAATQAINQTLELHKVRTNETGYSDRELVNQADPARSLPSWMRVATRPGCDYADLTFTIAGMYDQSAGDVDQLVYLRFRARKVGTTTWHNIGTVGYVGRGQSRYSRRVRMHFSVYPGNIAENPRNRHGFRAPANLPVVTIDHVQFKTTDATHFAPSAAFTWRRQREGIDVWLGADAHFLDPTARYEIEMMRSEMVEASEVSDIPTMQRASGPAYVDYFDARVVSGKWSVQEEIADQGEVVLLQSVASVFNRPPIPANAPIATIQVRVTNQQIPQLTALCSGLVPDLVDGAWTGLVATTNPAPHFRDLLTGPMAERRLADRYIDDDALADWHAECAARSWSCGLLLQGKLGDMLKAVAATGFARPVLDYRYGVVFRRDTSGDVATQMFTPINVRGLRWSMVYGSRPTAIRAAFVNAARNYEPDEILVQDPNPLPGARASIEAGDYPGLTSAAQVTERILFDYAQASNGIRWTFKVGIEHLATRVGEIAILVHDALDRQLAYARIEEKIDATHFALDAPIDWRGQGDLFDAPDFFGLKDVFAAGQPWGVAVRTNGRGAPATAVTDYDPETRIVTVASTEGFEAQNICAFGPISRFSRRVQITDIPEVRLHEATVVAQNEMVEI